MSCPYQQHGYAVCEIEEDSHLAVMKQRQAGE